tara:strand:+ start:257 stop:574 length:318 start_codon:yes stop_codon:yes gene_type:complete
MYMNIMLTGSQVNNSGKTKSIETNTFSPGMIPEMTPRLDPTMNANTNSNMSYEYNIPSDIQSTLLIDVSGGVPRRAGLLKPGFLPIQQVRFVPRHLNDGVTGNIY